MSASNAGSSARANLGERELVITRVFDRPREIVFKAWTDPKRVAQWWGPQRFTTPVCEVDARPGGAIRIHMRGPDGTVYPMRGAYQEVVAPERLVFTSLAVDDDDNPLLDGLTSVAFEDEAGKTKLTLQARAVAVVAPAVMYLDGMEAGWTQSLERLAEELAKP
jgi:uncharacterized protein YndB with AHSA1/START domain